jgi:Flp pilus assembly protein TadG
MRTKQLFRRLARHRGAAIIFVAFVLFLLIAMAGLAIDVGYVYTVRNELQNAADAAALAGAQVLYDDPTTTADDPPGSHVNPNANSVAQDFLNQNYSEKVQVTPESIERGHWSFATRTFTTNETDLAPVALWNVSEEELDANLHFVNAVRVVTERKRDAAGQLPEPFLARIFGGQAKEINGVAVAYIGFAGKLEPHAVDEPIAICREAITVNNLFTCGVGRMLNSGQNAGHQTAGWTNYSQPCTTANASDMSGLVCGGANGNNCTCGTGNPVVLDLGQNLGTTNGTETGPAYDAMRDNCWMGNTALAPQRYGSPPQNWPTKPWSITLPVIACPGGAVGNCSDLVGAVELDVVWMTRNDKNQMKEVPRKMSDWPRDDGSDGVLPDPVTGLCTGTGQQCWDSFVAHFNLQDILNGTPASYEDKTMYFLPDCAPHIPTGLTGGENFGILAKTPVLVNPYTLVK